MIKHKTAIALLVLMLLTTLNSCFILGDKHGRRTSRGPRFPHDEQPKGKS